MRRYLFPVFLAAGCTAAAASPEGPGYRDILPNTWVGRDPLGRTMPGHALVGPAKQDQRRVVGIFRIAWHSDSADAMNRRFDCRCVWKR